MLQNKKSEFGLISLLALLFGSVLIVSAEVLNSTDNSSVNIALNDTLLNISLINQSINLSISNNSVVENATLINETANLTIPAGNISNQSITINETINLTVPTENISIANQTTSNESINLTIPANETANLTIPSDNQTLINITLLEKPIKNLTKIIEKNKYKLNNETETYFKNIKDKKEVKNYIIKFRNSIDESNLVNVTLEKKIEKFKVTKIKGEVEDIEDLIEDAEIEFLELEQDVKVLEENIPFNIKKIKADSVWNLSNGSGVKVAVLDTGIDLHNDLAVVGGVSFVDNNYFDSNGHGTAVAGVIAALLNNEGLAGIAPDVSLYSVKIMQSSTGELSNAIAGIEWIIDNNMSIVSMSFGFDSYSQIFKEVLQEAYNNNILLVAASGNEGTDNILYPAKYDTVIAVGAIDENNNLALFSSYGFEQELVAYGVDINSTSLNNQYSTSSGTSLAAPHVAGVAALIKSYNKSLTNEQIRAKLRNDALDLGQSGKDDFYGYGLVQANLNTTNFTIINLSYFYEVFNISNFGLPNITFTFWLNRTGTIDDVSFSKGMYLVNITYNSSFRKSYIYNVTENGSIFILATNIEFRDFFSTDGGTTSDGIAWINDNITVKLTTNMGTVQVECFNVGPARQFNSFDYCYADTQTHMDQCDSDPDINCAQYTTCQVIGTSGIGTEKEIIDYTFATSNSSQGRIYTDCSSPGSSQQTSSSQTYYIVDRKAARCNNNSHYNISGWYGDNWIKIAQSTCSSGYKCVNSSNFTTESAYINPCISETTCTGTVQVITEDRNGNPLQNLLVSRDLVSNKTTNSVGVAEYSLSQTCNQNMEFKVYCSNSSTATLCGSKTAKLDVVNDYEGLLYDCSICSGSPDMQIDVDNVKVNKAASNITVNISLAGSVSGTSINLTLKVQGKDGLISREANQLFDVSGGSFRALNQTITINDKDDFLHVYVDTTNKVSESNEKNNYALVPLFEKQIKVYFDVDTGYASVNNEIKKYIKLFVNEETNQNNADVTLCVGRKCSNFNSLNSFTLNSILKSQKFGYKNKIVFEGKDVGSNKPYNGIVGGFWNDLDGKKYIMAYGIDIDGDIASVKKLVSAKDLFFNPDLLLQDRTKVIDDYDLTGISVFDLLHSKSNLPYYNQRGSDNFANVVNRILNNNNFEISIKTVKTYNDNTTLRLKNINTDYSANFKDAIVNTSKPVVLSRGIHSNLLTWNKFGQELAFDEKAARDTWLIEMVGGPTIDEDCQPSGTYNCPNYTFSDLKTFYWPALITGVQNYSAQKILDYVGYSLGCSVALESLKSYGSSGKTNAGYVFDSATGNYLTADLSSNPVDTFVAVACPGNFSKITTFIEVFNLTKERRFQRYNSKNINHIRGSDLRSDITIFDSVYIQLNYPSLSNRIDWSLFLFNWLIHPGDYKLSKNIYDDFYNWVNNASGPDIGKGVSVNNLLVIQGKSNTWLAKSLSGVINPTEIDENSDTIVPNQDTKDLCTNINSTNKYYASFDGRSHGGLFTITADRENVQKQIKTFLKDKKIVSDGTFQVNKNCELI